MSSRGWSCRWEGVHPVPLGGLRVPGAGRRGKQGAGHRPPRHSRRREPVARCDAQQSRLPVASGRTTSVRAPVGQGSRSRFQGERARPRHRNIAWSCRSIDHPPAAWGRSRRRPGLAVGPRRRRGRPRFHDLTADRGFRIGPAEHHLSFIHHQATHTRSSGSIVELLGIPDDAAGAVDLKLPARHVRTRGVVEGRDEVGSGRGPPGLHI